MPRTFTSSRSSRRSGRCCSTRATTARSTRTSSRARWRISTHLRSPSRCAAESLSPEGGSASAIVAGDAATHADTARRRDDLSADCAHRFGLRRVALAASMSPGSLVVTGPGVERRRPTGPIGDPKERLIPLPETAVSHRGGRRLWGTPVRRYSVRKPSAVLHGGDIGDSLRRGKNHRVRVYRREAH